VPVTHEQACRNPIARDERRLDSTLHALSTGGATRLVSVVLVVRACCARLKEMDAVGGGIYNCRGSNRTVGWSRWNVPVGMQERKSELRATELEAEEAEKHDCCHRQCLLIS